MFYHYIKTDKLLGHGELEEQLHFKIEKKVAKDEESEEQHTEVSERNKP